MADTGWTRQERRIFPSIMPTIAANSPAEDTLAQAELRAELRDSGIRMCYQSRRDGNSELYVMDAAGSNTVNITRTADIDEVYPHVSRDGQRICFTVVRTEKLSGGRRVPRFDVYWMNIDGTARTLVASDATDPGWDPSGRRIAFVKRISPEKTTDYQNTGLFIHDIRTRKTQELASGKLCHAYVPCWSPADEWITATVHKHADFNHAIIAVELRNNGIYSLENSGVNGCRPDLSWDGRFICWNPNDIQIGVARFRPFCAHRLPQYTVAQAPPPRGSVYFGDWSANGKYISYSMNPNVTVADSETRALWDIFVTTAKGETYVQLTFDHANNKQPDFFFSA